MKNELEGTYRNNGIKEEIDFPKTITSLEVSEMVGREHKNVLRDIQQIISDLVELKVEPISYFIQSTYKDSINRDKNCYLLTKIGCELYGNRMTGLEGTAFSIKYIAKFNEMEIPKQKKLPTNFKEALYLLIEAEEEKEQLQIENNDMKPKVQYHDNILNNESVMTTGLIAQEYGISAIQLNKLLHNLGVQYRQGKTWLLYSKHRDKGYTKAQSYEEHALL